MKKISVLACILISALAFTSPTSKYIKAMKTAITSLFQAKTMDDFAIAANTFERIGLAEENEWHPHYYLSLSRIFMSTQNTNPEEVDQLLDQAQKALDVVLRRHPSPHSEIEALQGFIHMLRIPIDPATRGPVMSGQAMEAFSKAVALNPQNPRAHFLLAQMQFGTASFFGSDIREACNSLDRAIELFENQPEPQKSLEPTWGEGQAKSLKRQCEGE